MSVSNTRRGSKSRIVPTEDKRKEKHKIDLVQLHIPSSDVISDLPLDSASKRISFSVPFFLPIEAVEQPCRARDTACLVVVEDLDSTDRPLSCHGDRGILPTVVRTHNVACRVFEVLPNNRGDLDCPHNDRDEAAALHIELYLRCNNSPGSQSCVAQSIQEDAPDILGNGVLGDNMMASAVSPYHNQAHNPSLKHERGIAPG